MADLSRLSTADLKALRGGNLSDVSTDGLKLLKGAEAAPRAKTSMLSAFASGDLQGLTLGAGDEATAGLSGDYNANIGPIRERMNNQWEDHPIAYGSGMALGAIANAITLGKLGALVAPKAEAGFEAYAQAHPYVASAAVGGPAGGVYGFDAGEEGFSERASEAVPAGALSAGLGPLATFGLRNVAAPAVKAGGSVLSKIANKAGEYIGREAPASPAIPESALEKVSKRLRSDFPDDQSFNSAMDEYVNTPDVGLAEVSGKKTGNLAKGAAQFPSGEAATEKYVEGRTAGTSSRMKQSVSDNLSKNTDFYGTLDKITEQGQAKAAPLYETAYKLNPSVVSPEIDKILETPAGRKALKEAATIMQNDRSLMGLPDAELKAVQRDMSAIGKMDEQSGPIASGLNFRTLDYVKKALDAQIKGAYSKPETTHMGSVINNLKNDLLSEMDSVDKSKAYSKGRAVAGDYLSNKAAMENGRDFVASDADTIKKTFSKLGDTQKEAFKAGMVRKVRDLIDQDPYKPQLYKRVFGPENSEMRNKLRAVMTPEEFGSLTKSIKAEERLYQFRTKTLGNSNTISKGIAAEEFDPETAQLLLDVGTKGPAKAAIGHMMKFVSRRFSGLSDKMAGKVANILYETDPEKKLIILRGLASRRTPGEQEAIKAYFEMDDMVSHARKSFSKEGGSLAAPVADKAIK